jgi:hypothetical protein
MSLGRIYWVSVKSGIGCEGVATTFRGPPRTVAGRCVAGVEPPIDARFANADCVRQASQKLMSTLNSWRFERLYNRLFGAVIEHHSNEDKWEYDPLDSKYPVIDGILRRQRKKEGQWEHLPEFALVQLKGTEFIDGQDSWPKLKNAFGARRDGKPNSIEAVNSMISSCPALLIGLSINVNTSNIEFAYIGAPEGFPPERKPEQRILPNDLVLTIATVLDAVRPVRNERIVIPGVVVAPAAAPVPVVRPVVYPRQKEIVYFNKQEDGTVSVGESGLIFGRNISINWTMPRGLTTISIQRISGSPVITMEPVALPRPPYNTYAINPPPENLRDGEYPAHRDLPNVRNDDLWWVLQIRFENLEATVKVEAV